MRLREESAARRYARALLEVAHETGQDPGPLRAELESVVALVGRERELEQALVHPALGGERRRAIAEAVFQGRVAELVARLVALLAERGRIALLPALARAYADALRAERGVVAALARSATPLDPEQRRSLEAAVARLAGAEVELETALDPALLGGVKLSIAGRTYDGSVRARLASLRARLVHGA
jgi:F-type H+-transporting ATPase subunit delta